MLSTCQQAHRSAAPVPTLVASRRLLYAATARLRRSSLFHGASARRHSLRFSFIAVQAHNSQQQQQLRLSILRFTLGKPSPSAPNPFICLISQENKFFLLATGIPGLDESYLPRWIGVAFGSLILLNHFTSSSPAPAQLISEAIGLVLAVFSTTLPYIGRFLKGENPVDRSILSEGNQQIFIMSDNLLDSQKEDFAWASYVILRNTNTMSVLIVVKKASCVRGYWNMPEGISKAQILELLTNKFEEAGFLHLKGTLYFPQKPDPELQQMLPRGTLSLLVQPISGDFSALDDNRTNIEGLILLASSADYAYSDKDIAWIRAISNKFQGFAQ